jgi:hypothetical protein
MSVEAPQSSRKRAAGGLSLRFLPLSPRRKRSDHKFPDHADMQEEQSPSVVSPEIGAHLVSCRLMRVQPSVPPVCGSAVSQFGLSHLNEKKGHVARKGFSRNEMDEGYHFLGYYSWAGRGGFGLFLLERELAECGRCFTSLRAAGLGVSRWLGLFDCCEQCLSHLLTVTLPVRWEMPRLDLRVNHLPEVM